MISYNQRLFLLHFSMISNIYEFLVWTHMLAVKLEKETSKTEEPEPVVTE